GTVPVTIRSGQQRIVRFRSACDKAMRYVVDQVAFLSLGKSEWARAYYDQQRARGHDHHPALRALGAKRLKIIFLMWARQYPSDGQHHMATITRQQLRQRSQKKVAWLGPEKVSHIARCVACHGVGSQPVPEHLAQADCPALTSCPE